MARGSHGQEIFQDDQDRHRFVETLGEACAKTGFRGNGSRTAGRPRRPTTRRAQSYYWRRDCDRAERSGLGRVVQGSSAEGGSGLVVAAAYGDAAAVGE